MIEINGRRYSFPKILTFGFLIMIILGTIFLLMPFATRPGLHTSFMTAFFTSTSATCVTGLTLVSTAGHWTPFGQIVIAILMEVGGLGFMTFATMAFRLLGRQISLRERMLIRESMNESGTGGMEELIRWVARSAFTVQLAGALALAVRFVPMYRWGKGIFYSVFHSVSAFCNAGFDLFGHYSSLTAFRSDVLINLTVIALVVIGGLGFGVLRDLVQRRKSGYLRLQTRLVLATYGLLMACGFLFVLVAEWNNPQTLGSLPFGEKLLAALFQSVTLRTAGFNTINQQALRPATKLISGMLMLIGASPASTGGGVKVTTVAVIFMAVYATGKGDSSIVAFRRNISGDTVRRALAVLMIALTIAMTDILVISLLQPELDFMDVVMECTSAMGTVGVSAFGSASLNTIPRIMIILTMYLGRIGPMTMALLLLHRQGKRKPVIHYPDGQIMIG